MHSLRTTSEFPVTLESTYARRFAGQERRREQVWQVLNCKFFSRWVSPNDAVLDLGAGFCEFINSIHARQKLAIDMNPATRSHAAPDVTVLSQDVRDCWNIRSSSLDVVFTSNFLEHLETKFDLLHCLSEARRVLRPRGRFIALGPNIRFAYRLYWDFCDHCLALSDRSLVEALELSGFHPAAVVPRFLPFTMRGRCPSHPFLLDLYLHLPPIWSLFGKQFLVVATT